MGSGQSRASVYNAWTQDASKDMDTADSTCNYIGQRTKVPIPWPALLCQEGRWHRYKGATVAKSAFDYVCGEKTHWLHKGLKDMRREQCYEGCESFAEKDQKENIRSTSPESV